MPNWKISFIVIWISVAIQISEKRIATIMYLYVIILVQCGKHLEVVMKFDVYKYVKFRLMCRKHSLDSLGVYKFDVFCAVEAHLRNMVFTWIFRPWDLQTKTLSAHCTVQLPRQNQLFREVWSMTCERKIPVHCLLKGWVLFVSSWYWFCVDT